VSVRPRTGQDAVAAVRHILSALGTKSRSLWVSDETRKATASGDPSVKLRHNLVSLLNMWGHSGASNCSLLNNKGNALSRYIIRRY
jgi:hypothetical protein